MRLRCLIALTLSLLFVPQLQAAKIEELAKGLRDEVEKWLANAKAGNPGIAFPLEYSVVHVKRLAVEVANGRYGAAENAIREIQMKSLTAEMRQHVIDIEAELKNASEQQLKAHGEQIATAIENAGKACLRAKNDTDLDALILDLDRLKLDRDDLSVSRSDNAVNRLNRRISGAIAFVDQWRGFLMLRSRGFERQANTLLQQLAGQTPIETDSSNFYSILTREQILSQVGKTRTELLSERLSAVKDLEELPKLIGEVGSDELENEVMADGSLRNLFTQSRQLIAANTAFNEGYYGSVFGTCARVQPSIDSPHITRLWASLTFKVLPRFLALSDQPMPKPTENPSQFLVRLVEEAFAKSDWERMVRVLDVYRQFAFLRNEEPGWIKSDLDACQHFLTGENFEKARQKIPAIIAYQRVLTFAGKYAPRDAAVARLAAMEKADPELFMEVNKEILKFQAQERQLKDSKSR